MKYIIILTALLPFTAAAQECCTQGNYSVEQQVISNQRDAAYQLQQQQNEIDSMQLQQYLQAQAQQRQDYQAEFDAEQRQLMQRDYR